MKTPYKLVLAATCIALAGAAITIALDKPDHSAPAAEQSTLTVEASAMQVAASTSL